MAEPSTFIKLDRNILGWRWYKNPNTFRVFLHLLITANISDHDFETITIRRGETATSYRALAAELEMSIQEVRTAISHLKSTGEITSKSYSKFQVFSIVNYSLYQKVSTGTSTSNQQAINKQSTSNQQQLKNNKNLKNEKNEKNNTCSFDEFWAAYPKKVAKPKAQTAWGKIGVNDALFAKIMDALEKQKKSPQWQKDDGQFIPHPTTWLNQQRWEDEVIESSQKGNSNVGTTNLGNDDDRFDNLPGIIKLG